jgi:nucleotide-binding universal stress UspA family protein
MTARAPFVVVRANDLRGWTRAVGSALIRRMQSVVVGTDGSPDADAALREAARIAKAEGAVVSLVTAFPDVPTYSEGIASSAKRDRIDLREVAEGVLSRAADDLRSQGLEVLTEAREGDPAQVILDVSRERDADLIVIGARGLTGIRRFLLGSVSSKLAHHADCSLMIVREKQAAGAA